MQLRYTNNKPEKQDYRDFILEIIEKRGISRNRLANILDVTSACLHRALVQKQSHLSMLLFHDICALVNIKFDMWDGNAVEDYRDSRLYSERITKSNLNHLESRFNEVNQDDVRFAADTTYDTEPEDSHTFDLQEFILEQQVGMNVLINSLTYEGKSRINAIVGTENGFKTLKERIRQLHRMNGELFPDDTGKLLQVAIRTWLRANIGGSTADLKNNMFPGNYNWDLCNYQEVPF